MEEIRNVLNEGKCWKGYAPGAQSGQKTKDSPTKPVERVKNCEEISEDFEPHMMYNPKTGEGIKAMTHDKHLELKKKGYTHEKPDVDEAKKKKPCKKAKGKSLSKELTDAVAPMDNQAKQKMAEPEYVPAPRKATHIALAPRR